MEKEVTCMNLWKSWQQSAPESPLVLTAQSRISNYTKQDWEDMVLDAKEVMQEMANLIINNIDIHDDLSKQAAIRLSDHTTKYFFPLDKNYAFGLKHAIINNDDYSNFFNQFHEGLADKVVELISKYVHTIN
jgi:hypothetical protein